MSQNDILVMNQERQQGAGNIYASLYLGKKIYVKENVSTYSYLNSQEHIKIYSSDIIKNLTFEDFIENKFKEQNKQNVEKFVDDKYLIEIWRNIFDAE